MSRSISFGSFASVQYLVNSSSNSNNVAVNQGDLQGAIWARITSTPAETGHGQRSFTMQHEQALLIKTIASAAPARSPGRIFDMSNHAIRRLVATILIGGLAGPSLAAMQPPGPPPAGDKIFSATFDPRPVDQVEIGDFHFTAGQLAPLHTHRAPVLGYVSKGSIYYQVADHPAVIVHAGEAFFEPVGPDIQHFDNASNTGEAIFTDFNLERAGEPFIVFPTPPTTKIDRRTFPTAKLDHPVIDRVDVYQATLAPAEALTPATPALPVFGYVAKGTIVLEIEGGQPQTIPAGQTFTEPAGKTVAVLKNGSATEPAQVVSFQFMNDRS